MGEVDDTVAVRVLATVFASDEDAMMKIESRSLQFNEKEDKTKVKGRRRINAISPFNPPACDVPREQSMLMNMEGSVIQCAQRL